MMVKLAELAMACAILSYGATSVSAVNAEPVNFSKSNLWTEGNAAVVASNAGTGKAPCPSLPQASEAPADTALSTPTQLSPAPAAKVETEKPDLTRIPKETETSIPKTPCPSLPQPSLSGSLSTDLTNNNNSISSKSSKSPCPSLPTKAPCPSLSTASKSSADESTSDDLKLTTSGLTIAVVSVSAILLL